VLTLVLTIGSIQPVLPSAKAGNKQAKAGWGEGVGHSAAALKVDGFIRTKNIEK